MTENLLKMSSSKQKICSYQEIIKKIEALRKENKTFVLTNGCFDILHLGHIRYLNEAKKLGDYLIVALNSDKSIKELKGQSRPINNETTRSEILSSLDPVDFIFLFSDKTAENIIKTIKPEIYAKGGDYTIDTINQDERKIIEEYGGKIFLLKGVPGVSTTKLINQMKN